MSDLLQIEDLATHIRLHRGEVVAVDRVSLRVQAGETVGLVGESGCGKTMLALSVMRLLPPGGLFKGGRIEYQGVDLLRLPERRMRAIRGSQIGMVFQDPSAALNPTMAVGEQVAEGASAHLHVSRKEALERAVEALARAGVSQASDVAGRYPHQLSGGLRQRVLIAMATICRPSLLLADEPTSAVDAPVAQQIMESIQAVKQEMGLAVLLLSHDRALVEGWSDRILEMRAGRLIDPSQPTRADRQYAPRAPLPPSAWGLG
jgi:peptide/nickel transport system ATP-binding protein